MLQFMLGSMSHFQRPRDGGGALQDPMGTKSGLQRKAVVRNGSGAPGSPVTIYIQSKRPQPSLGNAAEIGGGGGALAPTQAAAVPQGMHDNTSWARCS